MLKKIVIISFCLLNIALFVLIGFDVAVVTPEQAMSEGMTQRIYASISHIDYLMAILWGVILFTALTAKKEYFLRAVWLYLGFYLCDIHFGHYMAIEMNDTTWTMGALILVAVQSGFLFWAEKQINVANFVSRNCESE